MSQIPLCGDVWVQVRALISSRRVRAKQVCRGLSEGGRNTCVQASEKCPARPI